MALTTVGRYRQKVNRVEAMAVKAASGAAGSASPLYSGERAG